MADNMPPWYSNSYYTGKYFTIYSSLIWDSDNTLCYSNDNSE